MNQLKGFNVLVLFAFSLIVACTQTSNNSADHRDSTKHSDSISKVVLKNDTINAVYKDYILVKDALIASDVKTASQAGESLMKVLNKIKGCQNTAAFAGKIAASSQLAEQRLSFNSLSADIIPLMKHADISEGIMYVQFCPMTNSKKGGYWISSSDQIKNPYYGEKMLNCGEVKEKIMK